LSLKPFFNPDSVAIIGASNTPGKVGNVLARNLLKSGYSKPVYLVNIKGGQVLGRETYKSILDVPGEVELAVIAIPSRFVLETVEQCGVKGVKGVVVISAGFKEVGPEGAALERQLVETAHKYGMRVQGPNCLGLVGA